jgi:integrase
MTWEINVGRVAKPDQRYFTQDELRRIIEHSPTRYRTLFALLAGTGMRIGEAAGLHIEDVDLNQLVIHIRRAVWRGKEQTPKSENGHRDIDIDSTLAGLLREFIGTRRGGRLFPTRTDAPISGNNIRRRILQPLLVKSGTRGSRCCARTPRPPICKGSGSVTPRHAPLTGIRTSIRNGSTGESRRALWAWI